MIESYLVIPDSHGEHDTIAQVIEDNTDSVDAFVFLGDVLGGPNTAKLIGLIRNLGERAITIAGNHEWVCRNALSEDNNSYARIWRDQIWPKYERGILESYGIQRSLSWKSNADQLREAMTESGDLAWLNELPPYFSTDKFIALHSGPQLDRPWSDQAIDLDAASNFKSRLKEEPSQIFEKDLAIVADIPKHVDKRVFVSGHNHSNLTDNQRCAKRRVCLASNIKNGAPLYVWNSSDGQIKTYASLLS